LWDRLRAKPHPIERRQIRGAAMNALVKRFESCRLEAYRDSGGIWTIGWGRTAGINPNQTCTQEEADQWLAEDLHFAEAAVDDLVLVPLTDAMREALVSFVYNVGRGAFSRSALLGKLHDRDYLAVPEQLCRWRFVRKKPSLGLLRRRVAEAARFLEDGLP